MSSIKRKIAAGIVGVALGLAVGGVRADIIIDGIDVPLGAVFSSQNIEETLVTGPTTLGGPSQTLTGVGIVTSITTNPPVGTPTYVYGQGGLFLTFDFTFQSSFVLPPTPTAAGYVEFSSGTAEVCLTNFAPAPNTACPAGSIDWLTLTPQPFGTNVQVQTHGGPATTVLEATISNNDSLDNFTNASGAAFLDATGGAAASAFHTCAQTPTGTPAGPCPPNFADFIFGEQFSTTVSGTFPVSGTASIKGLTRTVPEPTSLLLLAGGLLGLGLSRRRSR